MKPVPADGKTIGEVMFRGNIVMRGYLKNPKATKDALKGGWFHSGDLGVMYPDGYIQLKDRSKDIIISGGENISSIEVEDAIASHPSVLFVAVVARPDAKWGEHPCAFVELRAGATATRRRHHRLRARQAGQIQAAAHHRLFRTAQDIHGQDPEIRAARKGEGLVSIPRRRRRMARLPQGEKEAQLTTLLSRSSSSLIRSFCFLSATTRISSQSGLAISVSMMSSIFLCWLDR